MTSALAPNLFVEPAAVVAPVSGGYAPRPYQAEDIAAAHEAWRTHQSVLYRAATGTGKAVVLSMIAQQMSDRGRVMILVDTLKLVRQLADDVRLQTGKPCGVLTGEEKIGLGRQIIVACVWSLHAGDDNLRVFQNFNPAEFACLLVDECESSLAPSYRTIVEHFTRGNSDLRMLGCTATPMRTDGVAMAELFDYGHNEPGVLNRDVRWGVDEGWLVRPRQAFVRVSVDFSTLRLTDRDDGKDYSDAELAERFIENEAALIELAQGIIRVAQDRKAIIVCPNRVEAAVALAHYLEGERPGCAQAVHGKMADPDRVMDAHRNDEFQFLTSVNMLTKGYNDPSCGIVFICRQTRSQRLYQQIVGRVLRPDKSIARRLGDLATAQERRELIAASPKPEALVCNMVGIEPDVRDMTIVDILGERLGEEVKARAKKQMLDQIEDEEQDADEQANRAAKEIAEEQRLKEEAERRERNRVRVDAEVQVEYADALGRQKVDGGRPQHMPNGVHRVLRDVAGIPDDVLRRLPPDHAKELSRRTMARKAQGLVYRYKMAKQLSKRGFDVKGMPHAKAKELISRIADNGWRVPDDLKPEVAA